MYTASIKCTEDELCILEKKFMNVDGFNYLQFLKMLIDINKKLKKCSVSNTPIRLCTKYMHRVYEYNRVGFRSSIERRETER